MIVAVGRGGGDAADSAVGATFDTLFPPADRDPTAAQPSAHVGHGTGRSPICTGNVASLEFIVGDQGRELDAARHKMERVTRERDKMASELAAKKEMLEDVISASRKAYDQIRLKVHQILLRALGTDLRSPAMDEQGDSVLARCATWPSTAPRSAKRPIGNATRRSASATGSAVESTTGATRVRMTYWG